MMRKKILFISRDDTYKQDGGSLVCKRNKRILEQLGFEITQLMVPVPTMKTRIINFIFLQSGGQTKILRKTFIVLLHDFDYVFFDGSTYGKWVKLARNLGKKCICFYHNAEYSYYKIKAKKTGQFLDRLILYYIKYNEGLSTKYSNALITLTERDSKELEVYYNRAADLIMPTSFESRDLKNLYKKYRKEQTPYLLFVGTNFFANVEGIEYFLKKIAPKIKMEVLIAGNINSYFEDNSGIPSNVKFLGQVDSLDELYVNSSAVIAPIFSGSGLKTKTAEALSYGKTVIGFKEAFVGINISDYPYAAILVKDNDQFIDAINNLDKSFNPNPQSIKLFQEQLTDQAQVPALNTLITSL